MKKEDTNLLLQYLTYDKYTGKLYLSVENKYKEIFPDLFHYVQFSIKHQSTIYKYKLKYTNLIWQLVYLHKPTAKEKIFHKDLDLTNFKLNNLILISTSTFFSIKEALDNLAGKLKLYPHPKDRYTYILEYKQKGRLHKENISDMQIAKKKMLKLQLKYMKFISSYVLTN